MDTTQHPLEATEGGLALLVAYARECIRLYFQAYLTDDAVTVAGGPADELRGVRVSPREAARQLLHHTPELFDEPMQEGLRRRGGALRRWMENPPKGLENFAELAASFKLEPQDLELFILSAATAIDPTMSKLYFYTWDDVQKRSADVGFLCQVLSMDAPAMFESYLDRFRIDQPLRKHRLVVLEDRHSNDDRLDLNLVDRRVRAADRVLDFLRQEEGQIPQVDESLAAVCLRTRESVTIESLPLPELNLQSLTQLARSRKLPAVFDGPSMPSQERSAQALATALGRGLLSADLTALLNLLPDELEARLVTLIREARFGNDLIYLKGEDLPGMISGPAMLVLHRVLRTEMVILGVQTLPSWAVSLTIGWPVISIPMPEPEHRLKLWVQAFDGDRRVPDADALGVIARRYEMSPAQIEKASAEARRLAQVSRHKRVELADLDKACRAHFAHQLSDLAELVPPMPFKAADLILPAPEKVKFDEILLYSEEREAIYGDWGFGEKFPYGRGLSVLFYGPPGTGKTMGATIIASTLGLDLFRVDLSRIMSRYVGETEKNLAKVFDEAERGRVMLLFDEADSLFTKRTEVRSSNDRYANLEVAFLLQRMENFEGVTVLTTNVEHNLDDAFKRRIRYRIYFPMPDDETRSRLWRSMLPKAAPVQPDIPFDLLGEYFEITGGHIKQAVLRAAFYAKRAGTSICFHHLVEGAIIECRELGMLISERMPKKLREAMQRSQGLPLDASLDAATATGPAITAAKS
jgi:predicted nucleic acid-binding protein